MSSNVNQFGYIGQPGPKTLTGASIVDAINKLPAGGGTVQLEAGIYVITTPIVISKSNIAIVGVSQAATVLQYDFQGKLFSLINTINYCEFSDLTIVGPDESKYSEATGISINGGGSHTIKDVNFFAGKIGIATGATRVVIDFCTGAPNGLDGIGSLIVCQKNTINNDCNAVITRCQAVFCKQPTFVINQAGGSVTVASCRAFFQSFGTTAVPCCQIGIASGVLDDVNISDFSNYGGGHSSLVKVQPSGTTVVGNIELSSCNGSGGVNGIDADMAALSGALNIHDCAFDSTTSHAIKLNNVKPAAGAAGGALVRGNRSAVSCANGLTMTLCDRSVVAGNAFYGAAAVCATLVSGTANNIYGNILKGALSDGGAGTVVTGANVSA